MDAESKMALWTLGFFVDWQCTVKSGLPERAVASCLMGSSNRARLCQRVGETKGARFGCGMWRRK